MRGVRNAGVSTRRPLAAAREQGERVVEAMMRSILAEIERVRALPL